MKLKERIGNTGQYHGNVEGLDIKNTNTEEDPIFMPSMDPFYFEYISDSTMSSSVKIVKGKKD